MKNTIDDLNRKYGICLRLIIFWHICGRRTPEVEVHRLFFLLHSTHTLALVFRSLNAKFIAEASSIQRRCRRSKEAPANESNVCFGVFFLLFLVGETPAWAQQIVCFISDMPKIDFQVRRHNIWRCMDEIYKANTRSANRSAQSAIHIIIIYKQESRSRLFLSPSAASFERKKANKHFCQNIVDFIMNFGNDVDQFWVPSISWYCKCENVFFWKHAPHIFGCYCLTSGRRIRFLISTRTHTQTPVEILTIFASTQFSVWFNLSMGKLYRFRVATIFMPIRNRLVNRVPAVATHMSHRE